jgi:pimeloyl-ACP methyl ester carboxylesterase
MKNRTHVVFVHGSWMGGWSWTKVLGHFQNVDVTVSTPTLSGISTLAQCDSGEIGLQRHVEDVLLHLRLLPEESVCLVGHSYGAMVAAEVAERRRDVVHQLIVLDGFVPFPGQSIFDMHPEVRGALEPLVWPNAPSFIQVPDAAFLGLTNCAAGPSIIERMRPMPLRTHVEKSQISGNWWPSKKHYVLFSDFPVFHETSRRAQREEWNVSEIAAGHMAIVTHPEQVAVRIRELVRHKP